MLAGVATVGPAQAAERTYAVVVGNRVPPGSYEGLRTLRYADDDAIRHAQLFERVAGDTRLLTVMDRDTRARHPDVVVDGPPNLVSLRKMVADLAKQAKAAQTAGDRVTFVLVFSGHGAVRADGESFLAMLDGELTREVMFDEIIAHFPADVVHVVIDACHAGGVVGVRGDDDEFGEEIDATSRPVSSADAERWLHARTLARFPHVGVLAAASAGEKAHEWSEIEAGVFSHEVLSALWGAGDINGDLRIEYSEVQAFVASANRAVDDPRAVPKIVAHPPDAFPHAAIVDLADIRDSAWVSGDASGLGRFHIELGNGRRHLDANLASTSARVAVPSAAVVFLRTDDREARIDASGGGTVTFEQLALRSLDSEARGSTAEAYRRGLFREPFTVDYYRGYIDSIDSPSVSFAPRPKLATAPTIAPVVEPRSVPPDRAASRRWRAPADLATRQRRGAIAIGVLAGGATVASIVTAAFAGQARADFNATELEQRSHDLSARHRRLATAAIATGTAAIVGWVVTGVLLGQSSKNRKTKKKSAR
ncbi:MAG TPA: caspase family protein [Nannocystaceae bacterium]|nr:caspase family protein [Nannocystaceae bacterium]